MSEALVVVAFTFLIAFLYASVGHGGASGYLAVLSFLALPHQAIAASALCLNLIVSGIACWTFRKARHFSFSLTWPFVAASVPAAFLGGLIKIPAPVYAWLLAGVLLYAALYLFFDVRKESEETPGSPVLSTSLFVGGLVGMFSGMVGVGGGIFLSPLLILARWADPKKTAATSAFFIFANSVSGLAARFLRGAFQISPSLSIMILAALAGGLIGAGLGARRFSCAGLRRILAFVLILAAGKWIVQAAAFRI